MVNTTTTTESIIIGCAIGVAFIGACITVTIIDKYNPELISNTPGVNQIVKSTYKIKDSITSLFYKEVGDNKESDIKTMVEEPENDSSGTTTPKARMQQTKFDASTQTTTTKVDASTQTTVDASTQTEDFPDVTVTIPSTPVTNVSTPITNISADVTANNLSTVTDFTSTAGLTSPSTEYQASENSTTVTSPTVSTTSPLEIVPARFTWVNQPSSVTDTPRTNTDQLPCNA